MEWYIVLLIIFGSLVIVMATGMPVALAFLVINIAGVLLLWGGAGGLLQLISHMWTSVSVFVYLPIPMFILLGEILFRSGMAQRAIDNVDLWIGRVPGRLSLLVVAVATIFSTMNGSTIATTAVLGDTLLPEMDKRGYKRQLSIGAIIGSGGLAMMIPPSGAAVMWAAIAGVSVADILISGIIPGFLMAFSYGFYIIGRCWLDPSLAPAYNVAHIPLSQKLSGFVKHLLPLSFIVFMVTGVILIGVATPSEAAALGALGALILCAIYKSLNRDLLKQSLTETLAVSVMFLFILSASDAYAQILAFTGAPRGMVTWVMGLSLPPIGIIIIIMVVLLILGMFMNMVSIMLITLPIFMPIIRGLHFDPVWFGLLFLLNMEMSLLTPPFGPVLFVMQGIAKDSTFGEIVRAGMPYLICNTVIMALIIAFPVLATWLPSIMQR